MWPEMKTRELTATALMLIACAAPAAAQDDGMPQGKRPTVSRDAPPSSNATVNLINLLVKQGTLTEEQAATLVKQADDEAYVARQATRDAAAKAEGAERKATTAADAVSPPGTKRVTYVPEIVRKQLREEIRAEVMDRAHKEGWASPGKYPEWAQRIRFYGDIRARYEGDYFPAGNGPLYNYNAINTGNPFLEDNVNAFNQYFPPSYNTTQDRNRFRFRARLGADVDLFNGFSAGLRIATGESSSPISTNQTFGGNGGNFSKYAVWLDRAFIKYQPMEDIVASAGRFDNPFWSPTDLVWYRDIGFDGFAVQAKYQVDEGFTPFFVGGAFPVFNTDLNAGLNTVDLSGPIKSPSRDKWLFGAQGGFSARFDPETNLTLAVAYYDFTNIRGRQSSACVVYTASDACDTDLLRPSFAQKGNTYMRLRNVPEILPLNPKDTGTLNYQYYGLASDFRPVVASAQLDLAQFSPIHVILDAEYVWNTAFDRSAVAAVAVRPNNFASTPDGSPGPYNGGNQGWLARLTVGNKEIKHLWDWNAHVGYKYLESDAMVDAFVDSDFGLGGTNLKGYFIGGNVGLGENIWSSVRWMSANNIAGLPYRVDIVQFDLNARF
ncbi:putative porin [Bradyrhizobium liaoningense]|uniref:putative porin n=1 Tax=Bradyrhizobium liaoningense TaxID=43992 RepID=UPI001BA9EE31|nr:putative porin [Bradyrhizobium liaoningense]MBR0858746.1 putative porin [Bradyrhizobium liaoningense]